MQVDLSGPVLKSLNAIASEMLAKRSRDLPLLRAVAITADAFKGIVLPAHTPTWIDFLIKNGLLLSYPEMHPHQQDPLLPPTDLICFSFERFQHHVIAKKLLETISDPVVSFSKGGCASFVLDDPWKWGGLTSALSALIPEKFGKELIDCLPPETRNKSDYHLAAAFIESVKWRDRRAFTERTRRILTLVRHSGRDDLALALEMSICEDHPFNAINLIHPALKRRNMPERDAWWSVWLSDVGGDSHPINNIIDWSLDGAKHIPSQEAHKLAAIVLAWTFSSSNRFLRDRATKALTALIEINYKIFDFLIEHFEEVDDLYIHERIYAAGYGAVCRNPEAAWLKELALISYKSIFSQAAPPLNLRLRDYAKGIVDIALVTNGSIKGIDISLVTPPYKSPKPQLNLDEKRLERIAEKAGDKRILSSCTWDDFGVYEIAPGTRRFVKVSLRDSQPFSAQEKYNLFVKEVITPHDKRRKAFDALEAAKYDLTTERLFIGRGDKKKIDKKAVAEKLLHIKKTKEEVLKLLTKKEIVRFEKEATPILDRLGPAVELPSFPLKQLQWWVAKRAYSYGWTKERFGEERRGYGSYSRDRAIVERIGKKYQWLALSELQCRLGDNYWIHEGYSDSTAEVYSGPLSVGFERDIDPTILYPDKISVKKDDSLAQQLMGVGIALEVCPDEDIGDWPFKFNPVDRLPALPIRQGLNQKKYTVLYEYRSVSEAFCSDEGDEDEFRGIRRNEFYFLSSIFLLKGKRDEFFDLLSSRKSFDIHDWTPAEFVDHGYLLEHPWCHTWKQDQWRESFWVEKNNLKVSIPVNGYRWESHLDRSMPEGCSAYLPAKWFSDALSLKRTDETATEYSSLDTEIAFTSGRDTDKGNFTAVDERLLNQYLKSNGLECVWVFLSERNTLMDGRIGGGSYRRTEGFAWQEKGRIACKAWNRDIKQ